MSLADKVKIELADLADIDGITRVLDSVPLRRDFVYGPDCFKENVKYSFIQSIRHEHEGVYVAKEGDEVVGFAWFMNHPPNNGTAILEMLAVRTDRQNQGIGLCLIKESSDKFVESQRELGSNLRTLHLTTNYSNDSARTIYQRAGFQPIALIPGFVGDGNIELFMLKKLNSEKAPDAYVTK